MANLNLSLPPGNTELIAAVLEQLHAEAAGAEIEQESLDLDNSKLRVEIQKFEAERDAAYLDVTAKTFALDAVKADAERARIHADQAKRANLDELAKDKFHGVYRFNGGVDSRSVDRAIDTLTVWDRRYDGMPFELVINSPGGDVISGMDFFDFIQEMKRRGRTIITATRGYAASMGGILLQAGLATPESPESKRVAGREAQVLIHEAATFTGGKTFELEDEVEFMKAIQRRILAIFAAGSKYAFENGTSELALTADQFAEGDKTLGVKGWNRRDWWLDSDESLRIGVVDEIR